MKSCQVRLLTFIAGLIVLGGCSTHQAFQKEPIDLRAKYVLLPIVNYSQAPMAGEKVGQVLETYLRSIGIERVVEYSVNDGESMLGLYSQQKKYDGAVAWAKQQDAMYWITGSVDEWRYKSGLDGEPAVGLTLKVLSAKTGDVLWLASAAKAGWGRESVSGVMHQTIEELVDEIND